MPATRERLIDAALHRFYRDGFRNVSLDQILTDVGISKTAFYKHFESKDDLILAVLEMRNRWLQDIFRQRARQQGGDSPAGQLRALFDVIDEIIGTELFQGCIFVNVVMEYPLPHEPAHIAAANHKQGIEDIVCDLAAGAGAVDARKMAQELCLIMEGAYVTRQVTGSRQSFDIARRLAEVVIAAHVPMAPRRQSSRPHRSKTG